MAARGLRAALLGRRFMVVLIVSLIIGGIAGVITFVGELDNVEPVAGRYRVVAVIVEPVTLTPEGPSGAIGRWTAPDGTVHTGKISASPRQPVGARQVIWTDKHGSPTEPPISWASNAGHAIFVAGIVAVIVAAIIEFARQVWRRGRPLIHPIDAEWQRISERWRRRYL